MKPERPTIRCRVLSLEPPRCEFVPDLPEYTDSVVTFDFTEALLADLGPTLLMLYASYAGPPVTRDALVELAQPCVSIEVEHATQAELMARAHEEYPAVLARARERIAAL
ncbi:MAG TPA: hypothetical protein GX715_07400 [Armatimonadetes bacterium]|nr:hypothetical protein [Armatimonadota bacterium]